MRMNGFKAVICVAALFSVLLVPTPGLAAPDGAIGLSQKADQSKPVTTEAPGRDFGRYERVSYVWPHEAGPHYGTVASRRDLEARAMVRTMVGDFDMSRGGFAALPERLRTSNKLGQLGAQYFLVQLHEDAVNDVAQELIGRISDNGGAIVGKLPVNTYLTRLTPSAFSAVQDTVGITAVEPYHPGLKLSPTIGRTPLADPLKAASEVVSVELKLFPQESAELVAASVAELGANVINVHSGAVYVDVHQSKLADLAGLEPVQAVFEALPIRPYAEETSTAVQVGGYDRLSTDRTEALGVIPSNTTPYTDAGIDGGGGSTGNALVMMMLDSGIQLDAADMSDTRTTAGVAGPAHRKVVRYQSTDQFGGNGDTLGCDDPGSGGLTHGHTVAAVTLGNAAFNDGQPEITVEDPDNPGNFFRVVGVAPGAKVSVFDAQDTPAVASCGDPLLGTFFVGDLWAAGAPEGSLEFALSNDDTRIANFSWGSDTNSYTANAADVDNFILENPEAMVFISAGNNSQDADNNDVPDAGTLGTPATTKNGIAMGAGDSIDPTGDARNIQQRANFSSVGPAGAFNRIAPLLLAPGDDLTARFGIDESYHCRSNDNDSTGDVECDLGLGSSGTSFSSPAAAGAGLLVLDYLQQGFYPDGTAGQPVERRRPDRRRERRGLGCVSSRPR